MHASHKFAFMFAGAELKIILCNKIDDQRTARNPTQIHFKFGEGMHVDNAIFGNNNGDYEDE